MTTGHEHTHAHQIVEIVDSENFTALEQAPDELVVLQMHERGFMMEIGFDEALELGRVMEKVVERVNAQR